MIRRLLLGGMIAAGVLGGAAGPVAARLPGDGGTPNRRDGQAALKPFGGLVGTWRGTGQPQRGGTRGAWTESAGWAWKLADDSASLEITVERGKYLRSARLQPGSKPNDYVLDATLADGTARTFAGHHDPGKPLALTADGVGEGLRRVTLTVPNDARFLLLLEAHPTDSAPFARLGEVGYTRNGVAFAAGDSGPVCIVTEGRGTIPISYQGKTYYVCCTGCKDLFTQDPAAILKEAAERDKAKGK